MRKDHRFIGVILLTFSVLFALHQSGITTWAEVLLPDDPGNEQGVDILLDAEDEDGDGEEEAEEALAQTSQIPEEDGAALILDEDDANVPAPDADLSETSMLEETQYLADAGTNAVNDGSDTAASITVTVDWNGSGLDTYTYYRKDTQSVQIKLQRRVKNGNDPWEDIYEDGQIKTWDISTLNNPDHSAADVIRSESTLSINNELPKSNSERQDYEYRALEVGYKMRNGVFVGSAYPSRVSVDEQGQENERIGAFTAAIERTEGSNQTKITNTLIVSDIAYSLKWEDHSNREGMRPKAVTAVLFENTSDTGTLAEDHSQSLEQSQTASDIWTATMHYPIYKVGGLAINYRIKLTFGEHSRDIRPEDYKAKVELSENAAEDKTFNGKGSANVNDILFNGSFQPVAGGSADNTTAIRLTLSHEDIQKINEVDASLTWNDRNNLFKDRPELAVLELHATYINAQGETVNVPAKTVEDVEVLDFSDSALDEYPVNQSVEKDENGNYTCSWTDLPKYMPGQVGKEISYWIEVAPLNGYTCESDPWADTVENRFVLTQKTVPLEAIVSWGDAAFAMDAPEKDGTATHIAITSYIAVERTTKDDPNDMDWERFAGSQGNGGSGDGLPVVQKCAKDTSEPARSTWSGLPMYDKEGQLYHYRAVEVGILYGNNEPPENEKVVDGRYMTAYMDGIWQVEKDTTTFQEMYTFGYYHYKSLTHFVSGGADGEQTLSGKYVTTITNTPYTGSITFRKVWDDHEDQDQIRPTSTKVTLTLDQAFGKDYIYHGAKTNWSDTVEVTAAGPDGIVGIADDWSYAWNNLPFSDLSGQELLYTLTEDAGSTAADSYAEPVISAAFRTFSSTDWSGAAFPGETWVENARADASGTVMTSLYQDLYVSQSKEPVYTSTSTYRPETVSVSASIVWEDQNNKDGSRGPVTLTLMQRKSDGTYAPVSLDQDGGPILPKSIGANVPAEGQTVCWDNLPKNSAGQPIAYSVQVSGKTVTGNVNTGYQAAGTGDTDEEENFTFAFTLQHTPRIIPEKPPAQQEKASSQPVKAQESKPVSASFTDLRLQRAQTTTSTMQVKWKRTDGAKSYVIYGSRAGETPRQIATVSAKRTTYTQKHLKKGCYYTYNVVALGANGRILATSPTIYAATKGGKNGNLVKIKVSKTKLTLKKGKSKTLKVKVTNAKGKKLKKYSPIRFETSNPAVAVVSSKGKVTAVGKGKCKVYVYGQDGTYKTVSVKVK